MTETAEATTVATVGGWSFELTAGGDLAHVRLDSIEVLRGVQFVVRDDAWGTIEGDRETRLVRCDDDGFAAELRSTHRFPSGVLHATARLEVAADRFRYEVEGRAEGTVATNRIGFVVLHPLSFAGAEVDLVGADGRRTRARFPVDVAPHQPWLGISGLAMTVPASGRRLEIELSGDVFETEDQRNWSDASFKTYSRPLSLPFPYLLTSGETVSQAVEVRATGTRAGGPAAEGAGEERPRWTVDRSDARPRPALGIQLGPDDLPLDPSEVADLADGLHADHVRVDVVCGPAGLLGAEGLVSAGSLPLELAVHLDADGDQALAALRRLLADRSGPLRSVLLFDALATVTATDAVERLRRALGEVLDGAAIAVGTDDNLAELSRGRPAVDGADEVTFSLNPQVHDPSDRAILETVEALPAMIRTASALAPGLGVGIGALTLRPRRSLYRQGEVIDRLARDAGSLDPRQADDFAAAWLTATLCALIASGVTRITTLELTGPRGATVPPGPGHACPTPAGEVLALVAASASAGAPLVDLGAGVALLPLGERPGARIDHALVADLSGRPRLLEVDGLSVALSPYQVRSIGLD